MGSKKGGVYTKRQALPLGRSKKLGEDEEDTKKEFLAKGKR